MFAVHRIDEQLAKAMDRKVWLPSGGTLVIDRTEAMTVVDVNTGKFTGSGGNLEQTVTKNNLEAAEEIVRQLRLRDIGGIIVIDFIDMVLESNRDLVLRRLTEALARDRTRHQVSEVTSLGLVQLTRKRLGTGLIEAFSTSCPHCGGRGLLLHADPVDSAPANGRKPAESGGRRGRRSKKGRSEEPVEKAVVAKVPAHAPGEHPMFKAMAAGTSGPAGDESDESTEELTEEIEERTDERVAGDQEDLVDADQEDFEDVDEDSDEDEDELDDDEEDLDDVDEDLDDVDEDLELDDDDDDLEDTDDSEDSDDEKTPTSTTPLTTLVSTSGPSRWSASSRRRRAAGRPAGPPSMWTDRGLVSRGRFDPVAAGHVPLDSCRQAGRPAVAGDSGQCAPRPKTHHAHRR